MNPADAIVYRALVAAAELGAPCPTNGELAHLAGWQSDQSAGDAIRRLERAHRIKITRVQNGREIMIADSRKVTTSATYAAVVRRNTARRAFVEEVLPPVIRRDPCPRCAVRADHGCSHGWTGEYFRIAA